MCLYVDGDKGPEGGLETTWEEPRVEVEGTSWTKLGKASTFQECDFLQMAGALNVIMTVVG